MASTANELSLDFLRNPLLIKHHILSNFENSIGKGYTLVDPNNSFTFLVEMAGSITGDAVNGFMQRFPALYPKRAQTSKDLDRHASGFDYLGRYSTPATTNLMFGIDRTWVIENAVRYNNYYRKLVLPKTTTFQIGSYLFGIYYPIEIRVTPVFDAFTGEIDVDRSTISVTYDISEDNPLYPLESNVIESRVYTEGSSDIPIDILSIVIPIHQFANISYTEDVVVSKGFSKRYTYDDKFYAIRIYHGDGTNWTEIEQTMSDYTYDPDTLTAIVNVYDDVNQIEVAIPQIYLNRGIVGSKLKIEVLTTSGAINLDTTSLTSEQITVSFVNKYDEMEGNATYTKPFRKPPPLTLVPNNFISGGSNGITFEEYRRRVITGTLYGEALIRPAQIINKLEDMGYSAYRYIDDYDSRMYMAQKHLLTNDGVVIGAGAIDIEFTNEHLTGTLESTGYIVKDYSTIKTDGSGVFTVLPNTIYKYNYSKRVAEVLDDSTRLDLLRSQGSTKVETLNNAAYLYSPFHLKVDLQDNKPLASTYNLMRPYVHKTNFIWENTNFASRVSIYKTYLVHDDGGVGGYSLFIQVYKTEDLNELTYETNDVPNYRVVLYTYNRDGRLVYLEGEFIGTSGDRDVIKFNLESTYQINNDDYINIESFHIMSNGNDTISSLIKLDHEYQLHFFLKSSVLEDGGSWAGVPTDMYPSGFGDYILCAKQTFNLHLGEAVPLIMNNINVGFHHRGYLTQPTTKFATYATNVYKRDAQGNVIFPLEILHHAGDVIISDNTPFIDAKVISGDSVLDYTFELAEPYTAFSDPENIWVSTDNTYAIQVMDALEMMVAIITDTAHDGFLVPTSVHTSVEAVYRTYNISDNTINDPVGIYNLIYISARPAADGDDADLVITPGGAGAIYRRKADYMKIDPLLFIDSLSLINFYVDYDNLVSNSELKTKYGLSDEQITDLINWRFPWVKSVIADTLGDISDYIDTSMSNGIPLTELVTLKEAALTAESVDGIEDLAETPTNGTVTYVNDLGEDYAFTELFFKLAVLDSETRGGLMVYREGAWALLGSGPAFNPVVTEFRSVSTRNGMMLTIGVTPTSGGIPLQFALFENSEGKVQLEAEETAWGVIDQWPWEVTDWMATDGAVAPISLSFDRDSNPPFEYFKGDIVLDEHGYPIEDSEQSNTFSYYINNILIDYKLSQATAGDYVNFTDNMIDYIESCVTPLESFTSQLAEQTSVYFSPFTTIGIGTFSTGTADSTELELSIEMGFRIHAPRYVIEDINKQTAIRHNLLKIIDQHITSGQLSMTAVSNQAKDENEDEIIFVDNLGINNDYTLQTIIPVDETSTPHLKQILVLNDDGTFTIEQGLNLEFKVIPGT